MNVEGIFAPVWCRGGIVSVPHFASDEYYKLMMAGDVDGIAANDMLDDDGAGKGSKGAVTKPAVEGKKRNFKLAESQ